MPMRNFIKFAFAFLFVTLVLSSCKKDIEGDTTSSLNKVEEYNNHVLHEWNDLFLRIERHGAGYRPCPTANALGYIGLANYEACVTGMPAYASLEGYYNNINIPSALVNQEYHWPTVVNAVNRYMYSRLFPEVRQELYSEIKVLADKLDKEFEADATADVLIRSKNHGEAVAAAVWEYMKTDPATFDKYKDPFENYDWEANYKKDGDWVPTFPGPNKGMFPYWGKARTMAIKEDLKLCRPYSTYTEYSEDPKSGFYAQAIEVYSKNTPALDYQSEWVGEFWSDDLLDLTFSPPSRWIAIANQVYKYEDASLEEAIVANAKVGIALHDAAIGCWNSKYHYNLERPESYIQRVIDPTWEPNLDNPLTGDGGISPSFPAYPSGHSTFGAASAEVLASVFGYSYAMTDNCHKNRSEFSGYPRSFTSFYEMANENAWSRVPLGVHFRMDAEEGMRYGTEIGRAVNRLNWKK